MALSFLTRNSNASSARFFEIRVDDSNIILRGSPGDAPGALLKGKVVLCLSEPLRINNIHLRLTGQMKICFRWGTNTRGLPNIIYQEQELMRESWTFVNSGKGLFKTLPAGNYEYPFDTVIRGDSSESVEGASDNWIVYRMKATIDRGLLSTNVYARKHIRVIRTFDAGALELAHAMSVETTWPNKLDYTISTPCKGAILGTTIPIEFRLVPLLKGLKIGKIESELSETRAVTTEPMGYLRRQGIMIRSVAKDEWVLPDDFVPEDIDGQEGYRFTRSVQIPKSLKRCLQSVEEKGFKVRHKLKFVVQLHNPDGHTSELRANLPVHIFISPHLLVNEDHELIDQRPQTLRDHEGLTNHAPPIYGEHQLDQLYSDLDPSGYLTPAVASGVNTPLHARSRSGSIENMDSVNLVAANEISPSSLQTRLSGLQNPGSSRWARERAHGSRGGSSENGADGQRTLQSCVIPRSRRVSAEEDGVASGSQSPQHIEINSEDLSRVPSYQTALKTPVRGSYSADLPNYQTAVSRPSTPPINRTPLQALTARSASLTQMHPPPLLSQPLPSRRSAHNLRNSSGRSH